MLDPRNIYRLLLKLYPARFREEYGGRQRSCGPLTFAYHPPGELHAEHIGRSEVWSFNIEVMPDWAPFAGAPVRLDRPFDTRGEPLVGLAVRLFHEFTRPDAASALRPSSRWRSRSPACPARPRPSRSP